MGKGKENGGITVTRRENMKITIEYSSNGTRLEEDLGKLEKLAKALKENAKRKRILEEKKKEGGKI